MSQPKVIDRPRSEEIKVISMAMLTKVLRRNADAALVSTPEGNLILAIISTALYDADARNFRLEARHFFVDGRLDCIAPLIGLNADFVRESIRKVRVWLPA